MSGTLDRKAFVPGCRRACACRRSLGLGIEEFFFATGLFVVFMGGGRLACAVGAGETAMMMIGECYMGVLVVCCSLDGGVEEEWRVDTRRWSRMKQMPMVGADRAISEWLDGL